MNFFWAGEASLFAEEAAGQGRGDDAGDLWLAATLGPPHETCGQHTLRIELMSSRGH